MLLDTPLSKAGTHLVLASLALMAVTVSVCASSDTWLGTDSANAESFVVTEHEVPLAAATPMPQYTAGLPVTVSPAVMLPTVVICDDTVALAAVSDEVVKATLL